MTKQNLTLVLSIVAVLGVGALVLGLVGNNQPDNLGSGTRFQNGISTDSTSPTAGQVRTTTLTTTGAATFGGDVTVTTSNSATSSITVGCIDTYATSTATAIRLSATTTPGIAYWSYGTCSSL